MKKKHTRNIYIIVFSIVTSIFVILTISLYINNIRKIIDIGIYSNEYHYLECEKLPDYEESIIKFKSKINEMLSLIKRLEQPDVLNIPNSQVPDYTILNEALSGGFITIRLNKTCNSKAEINITVTSNKYNNSLKKYLNENLANIPYNILNN
jgi:hypothetical protein